MNLNEFIKIDEKAGRTYNEILTDLCEIYSDEKSFATLKSLKTFEKQGRKGEVFNFNDGFLQM